jgi:flavin reductase (DIM6/NTAB) family NADH-FMN oxidoreductase RutF
MNTNGMEESSMPVSEEVIKKVMRRWPSGVAIVSSVYKQTFHGLTANSFTSVSIKPPIVSVTINNLTRTHHMIQDSGIFGITILSETQADLSERFAGRTHEDDRFKGLDIFTLISGVPLIFGGAAHLDCRIIYSYGMPNSTLFLGEVTSAQISETITPLIYFNREYHQL